MSLGLGPLGTHPLGLPPNSSTAAPQSSPAPLPQLALLGGATANGSAGTGTTSSTASAATLTINYGQATPMPLPQLALLGGATATGGTDLQAPPVSTASDAAPCALMVRVPLAGTGETAVTNTGSVFKDYSFPMPLPQLALLGGGTEVGVSFTNTELTGAGIDLLWLRARAAALHDDGAVLAGTGRTDSSGAAPLTRPVPLDAAPASTPWDAPPADLTVSTLISAPESVTESVAAPALLQTYRLLTGAGITPCGAAAAPLTVRAALAGAGSTATRGSGLMNGAALAGAGSTATRGAGAFTPGAPFQQIAGTGTTRTTGQAELDLGLPRVMLAGEASTPTSATAALTPGALLVQLTGAGETRALAAGVSLAVRVALQAITTARSTARATLTVPGLPPPPEELDYTRAPAGHGFNPFQAGPRTPRRRAKQIRFPR